MSSGASRPSQYYIVQVVDYQTQGYDKQCSAAIVQIIMLLYKYSAVILRRNNGGSYCCIWRMGN